MQSNRLRIGLGAAALAAIFSWLVMRIEAPAITANDLATDTSDGSFEPTVESRPEPTIRDHGSRPVLRDEARGEGQPLAETRTGSLARRIERSIDAMDVAEIQRELGELAGIDEEWLKRDGIDPRAFAKRLAAVAGRGFSLDPLSSGARFERTEPDDDEDVAPLAFSSSLDEVHGALASTLQFSPSDVTIRAHVSSDAIGEAHEPVLIRWIDVAGARIEMMQAVRLTPDAGSGTRSFAMRRPEGWSLGTRDVEVYALTDGLPQIAAGSFEIVDAEALHWLDATSSIEIRRVGDDAAENYLDALRTENGSVRIGVRSVADLTGAVLRLAPAMGSGGPLEITLRADADESAWWSAELDADLEPGIWEARVERFGSLLERKSFRSLAR